MMRHQDRGTARGTRAGVSLLLAALVGLVLAGAAPGQDPAAQNRALYVWNLEEELEQPESLLGLAETATIKHFYLAVSKTIVSSMSSTLASFLDDAVGDGITSDAVLSEPTWALSENHASGLQRVADLLAMNRGFTGPGKLVGIHVDVEVHALPEFKDAKKLLGTDPEALLIIQDLLGQWLDFVDQVALLARAETPPLQVSVIAPQWFMKADSPYELTWHGQYMNVTDHLLRIADEVVVLAYYYKPLKIAKRAEEEVAAAAAPGTGTVRVAINVSHKSSPTETLWYGGLSAMEEALAHIQLTFEGEPGYGGTAIHMAESLRLLYE